MAVPPNSVTVVIDGVTYTGPLTAVVPPSNYARPAVNTGTGLYIAGGRLNNPDASEFRLRGVDINHYDNGYDVAGVSNTKANMTRVFLTQEYGWSPAQLAARLQQETAAKRIVMPVLDSVNTGTVAAPVWVNTGGNQSAAILQDVVAWWVANASLFAPILNKAGILNIANEWGPSNSTVWQTSYQSAVKALRAASPPYLCPIICDSGGYGQDELDLSTYAASVLAADPQANTMFAYHLYGGTTTYACPIASVSGQVITLNSTSPTHPFAPNYTGAAGSNSYSGITQMVALGINFAVLQNVGGTPGAWTVTCANSNTPGPALAGATLSDWNNYALRIPRLAALAKQNVVVAITEFGPGNNVGPSPTLVTPQEVVATCEANGTGWVGWAWDDNNAANMLSIPPWFNMTVVAGLYNVASDLTPYGQYIVGALVSTGAIPSTIF